MALYGYNPMTYNPYQQQAYQQYAQAQTSQAAQQPQPNFTTQNFGFVSVRSEDEARSYPVAPGNSVTFKDETSPYVYTKTMGFSQLDRPIFERYKLVKENPPITPAESTKADEGKDTAYALKSDLDALYGEIEALKAKLDKKPKKAVSDNDE